jgi:hypothetical protein
MDSDFTKNLRPKLVVDIVPDVILVADSNYYEESNQAFVPSEIRTIGAGVLLAAPSAITCQVFF